MDEEIRAYEEGLRNGLKYTRPLTQKQIEAVYFSVPTKTNSFWWDFARAIEKAHGIGEKE